MSVTQACCRADIFSVAGGNNRRAEIGLQYTGFTIVDHGLKINAIHCRCNKGQDEQLSPLNFSLAKKFSSCRQIFVQQ